MIVGSIKENTTLEKRVSITPDSAKNIIGLGIRVCVEKGYALHLGIDDNEYKAVGVDLKGSSKEILEISNLITKVNCPSENEVEILKEKGIRAFTNYRDNSRQYITKILTWILITLYARQHCVGQTVGHSLELSCGEFMA